MDPFATLQNNMQRDNITREITGLITQVLDGNLADARRTVNELNNRVQGIAQPVQEIRDFAFRVPADTFAEVFTRQHYTRPRPMVHYKVELGKNYYNANAAAVVWEDPDAIGHIAREAHLAAHPNANEAALHAVFTNARNAQIVANRAADREIPNWVKCQRTEQNDTKSEDMLIIYTDESQKKVDWYQTIRNLDNLGFDLGYTLPHYARAMQRFVSYFNPSLTSLIQGMDANEMARFLMSLNTPIPDKQRHFKAIKEMVRPVGQDLRLQMSELHVRAIGYYNDQAAEQRPNLINNMMIQGLQAFTSGQTNTNLRASIQQQILQDQPLNWNRMLETAILSEETWGKPTTALYFMPSNAQTSFFNTVPLFNATIQPVSPLVEPISPLVTPLVHSDPRNRQQFFSIPDYSQAGQNHNGFINMQNPIMPIQPPVQPHVLPLNRGNVGNVNNPFNGLGGQNQQAPQVPAPQQPVVPPQVPEHQQQIIPAQIPAPQNQLMLPQAPQQQQVAVPLAPVQQQVLVPQNQVLQYEGGARAREPGQINHPPPADRHRGLESPATITRRLAREAADNLYDEILNEEMTRHHNNEALMNEQAAVQPLIDALHRFGEMAFPVNTPPDTPMDRVEPPRRDTPQNNYYLRNRPGRNNEEHRRNLEHQAFNNNVIINPAASLNRPVSSLIQILMQQDKAVKQLQSQLESISLNATNVQQPPMAMPHDIAPSNKMRSDYRQQTPPRQYQRYDNPRPNSPGFNRNNRDRTPPYQGNNRYRSNTPPYQGNNSYRSNASYQRNNDYNRQRTPQRENQYTSRYNNDRERSRTPPSYNSYRDSRNNYDRSRSPGYASNAPRNTYQRDSYSSRPYSPNSSYQQQSPRPLYRAPSPGNSNYRNDRDRSQSPRNYRDRNRSPGNQQRALPAPILTGVNCNPNYTKQQGLLCTKCNTFGKHEEHACPTYYIWAPKSCYICKNGFHTSSDCTNRPPRDKTPDRDQPRNNNHLKN
jgi:hypothetical protein